MTHLQLGPGGEFDRIRRIAERLGDAAGALGDDCALVAWPGGTLVLSTDATIEGVHFRRAWLTNRELGWRATARALSDLAADGADAIGVLVALTSPADAEPDAAAEVMAGAADAAASVGARVLGGDLSAGERWHLVVTVVGAATRPVTRAGAAPGDSLWLSGQLGAAGSALRAWLAEEEPDPAARMAFAHPEPRIPLGRELAAAGAHAMIDISDGLAPDAAHLAAASQVRMIIDLELVPFFTPSAAPSRPQPPSILSRPQPPSAALGTGDDYELLVAMPPAFAADEAAAIAARTGVALTRIGRAEQGTGAVILDGGREVAASGWDHFAPR